MIRGCAHPPGIDVANGAYVNQHHLHIDMGVFNSQIRAFRQWMKERGQQDKPLIVTEYGVLYDIFSEDQVHNFMLDTFDYFATEKDCNLSSVDGCRLVQRWAWFSLEDIGWNFSPHGALFDKDSKRILPAGEKYRSYVLDNLEVLNNYHP
ncbi:MAG: hypothetical protein HC802_21405 [Caldilineaceae bacterium]|nr:hypothetical protein [Caldilineaceae bacterium]